MILGTPIWRDHGIEWVLRIVTTALLPSLAPEPLILGGMMLLSRVRLFSGSGRPASR